MTNAFGTLDLLVNVPRIDLDSRHGSFSTCPSHAATLTDYARMTRAALPYLESGAVVVNTVVSATAELFRFGDSLSLQLRAQGIAVLTLDLNVSASPDDLSANVHTGRASLIPIA